MKQIAALALVACLASGPLTARAENEPGKAWSVTLEAGAVWQGRNDVAIPGDTGTEFSMASLQGRGPRGAARMTVTRNDGPSNRWRLLVAPLTIRGTGSLPGPTQFGSVTFAAGTPTRGLYQFNSYRLTYMRRFHHSDRADWYFGGTLKVRDARVELRQGSLQASNYDLGLVPLAHVSGELRPTPGWRVTIDFDGLAAPQGRAFDIGVHAMRDLTPDWSLGIGYRTLEGGADNDRVYTFAWLNYVTLRSEYRF